MSMYPFVVNTVSINLYEPSVLGEKNIRNTVVSKLLAQKFLHVRIDGTHMIIVPYCCVKRYFESKCVVQNYDN